MGKQKLQEPEKFTWNGGDLTWDEQPGEQIDIHSKDTDE